MSSYLDLAEKILSIANRPLNSRQIIGTAFSLDIMPDHLHGQTQHKTLQARLSEDILKNKDNSRFYRTGKGEFFLRASLENHRNPQFPEVKARRRILDLRFKDVLSLPNGKAPSSENWISSENFEKLKGATFYQNFKDAPSDTITIWVCAIIDKEGSLLTYRRGSFREDRDGFRDMRSIALFSPVIAKDHDLFGRFDLGLQNACIEIVALDLDAPLNSGWIEDSEIRDLGFYVDIDNQAHRPGTLLAVKKFKVPSYFEVPRQRLSINDIAWVEPRMINDITAYDPWSRELLKRLAISE